MTSYELEPFDWQYRLGQLSVVLRENRTYVEIAGESFADHLENSAIVLKKLSYDYDSDCVEIMLGQSNHMIESPLTISFQQHNDILEAIEILDDNVKKHIIVFIEPLLIAEHQ